VAERKIKEAAVGFFDAPQVETDEQEFARKAWLGPEDALMGAVLPVNRVVVSDGDSAVALREIVVYPDGCMLDVQAVARRTEMSAKKWKAICESMDDGAKSGAGYGSGKAMSLRLGVLYSGRPKGRHARR
jgi:hypothetical protein